MLTLNKILLFLAGRWEVLGGYPPHPPLSPQGLKRSLPVKRPTHAETRRDQLRQGELFVLNKLVCLSYNYELTAQGS